MKRYARGTGAGSGGSFRSKGATCLLRRILLALGLALSGILGAQGQPPSAPPDNGVTFGVREDFPPFEYVDASGEVAGWDAEIVREAARIAGIEVRFVSGSLSEIRAQFENGEIDALAGMQWSEQRAQMARFTRPHFEVLYALYVRESESEPALKDFKGRRILVREGSLMADELARMGYGQDLVLVPSEAEALRRLANGEGDCAVAPQLVGDALQKGGKTMPVALGRTLLFRGKLCLVAQKGDVALAQAFDRAISELQRTGRYGELLAFAFADQGTDPNRPPGITYWLLLPVGGALLVAAAWYYTIRRQVVKKTLFIKEELQRSEAMREALANSELLYRSAIEATKGVPYRLRYDNPDDPTGREGHYEFLGEGIEALVGVPASQLDWNTMGTIAHYTYDGGQTTQEELQSRAKLYRTGKLPRWHGEFAVRHPDGTVRWLQDDAIPVLDESAQRVIGSLGILHDITERKESERRIRSLNSELEARVRERTSDLQRTVSDLESFTYTVAHDLREPIRAISLLAGLIKEDSSTQVEPMTIDSLDRIEQSAQRLSRLVDGMLKLSRVSRTEITKEDVNLSAIAEDVAAHLMALRPYRDLRFRIEPDVLAHGDPDLLRSLIENLLSNAAKFSCQVDQPLIEFGATESKGRRVYFVKDNGVGFDPRYADKLFRPFERLHDSSDFPGSGVGLATVQRVVERHGGTVWASSGSGEGATFFFELGSDDNQATPPSPLE